MTQPTQSQATRRSFLKLATAGAAAVATGPWVSRHAQAKPVSITFARESSYVKNFDVHFQNVMAPAYEKATGIKIEYQIQAAGGSAVPQLVSTTIVPGTYRRDAGTSTSAGPMRKPPASRSSMAPKTLGESNRGRQSHSTLPPGATSAVVSQSERKA